MNVFLIPGGFNLRTVQGKAVVVHEAVHALADRSMNRRDAPPVSKIDDEVAACLAQIMYLRMKRVRISAAGWLHDVFEAGKLTADRILNGGYEVWSEEWLDLSKAIQENPTYRRRAYDIMPYDGIG